MVSLWPAGVAEFGAGQAESGHDGHGCGEGQHRDLGREVLQEQAAAADAEAGDISVSVAIGFYRPTT
jgi:hypothetical protein